LAIDIRLATIDDAAQIQAIYEPIVLETAISFELVPPTVEEFQDRITRTLEKMPWLVCDIDRVVAGYAYAGQFRPREAYQWSAEVTVYVNPEFHRRGVGKAIYTSLFQCLRLQGYRSAYGGIALPNEASIALHESLGFTHIGTYKAVGYKLGEWRDVGWWQLEVQPTDGSPSAPIALPEAKNTEYFGRALSSGLAEVR
jgi:phosphinothricin acetyltransferase